MPLAATAALLLPEEVYGKHGAHSVTDHRRRREKLPSTLESFSVTGEMVYLGAESTSPLSFSTYLISLWKVMTLLMKTPPPLSFTGEHKHTKGATKRQSLFSPKKRLGKSETGRYNKNEVLFFLSLAQCKNGYKYWPFFSQGEKGRRSCLLFFRSVFVPGITG